MIDKRYLIFAHLLRTMFEYIWTQKWVYIFRKHYGVKKFERIWKIMYLQQGRAKTVAAQK